MTGRSALRLSIAFGVFAFQMSVPPPAAAWRAYVPNVNDGTISVINTAGNRVGRTITNLANGAGTGVAVSPGGSPVYVVDSSAGLYIIDGRSNRLIASMPLPQSSPFAAALNADGTRLYVAYNEGHLSVLDVTTMPPTVLTTFPFASGFTSETAVAVTPDGTHVYVSDQADNVVAVVDTAINAVATTVPLPAQPRGLAVTPDGTRVYAAEFDANVQVIDTASNTIVATVSLLGMGGCASFCHGIGVAVRPDGARVYVSDDYVGDVFVIDPSINAAVASVESTTVDNVATPLGFNGPYGLSITPDGKRLYVADGTNNVVAVVDTTTNILFKTMDVGANPQALGQFIDPAPYGIRGKVREFNSGSSAAGAGAAVTLQAPGGRTVSATADARGRFRFQHLPAGTYTVDAAAPGFAFSPVTVLLTTHDQSVVVNGTVN